MTGRSQASEDGCTGRTFQAEGAVGPEGTRRPAPMTPRETARLQRGGWAFPPEGPARCRERAGAWAPEGRRPGGQASGC